MLCHKRRPASMPPTAMIASRTMSRRSREGLRPPCRRLTTLDANARHRRGTCLRSGGFPRSWTRPGSWALDRKPLASKSGSYPSPADRTSARRTCRCRTQSGWPTTSCKPHQTSPQDFRFFQTTSIQPFCISSQVCKPHWTALVGSGLRGLSSELSQRPVHVSWLPLGTWSGVSRR
jgi:hypothetical protein